MSINANKLVNITPRVIGAGATDLETIGNVLTKNDRIPLGDMALTFGSASEVATFFGDESAEYDFAAQYFAGVTNQTKGITSLVISRRIDVACPAWIRGATLSHSLAQFKEVTDGAFSIAVDGTVKTVADIDLSEATSLSNIATTIATAIGGVTGAYDSVKKGFVFTTVSVGDEAEIGYAVAPQTGTDLGAMLGLTEEEGAVLSGGSAAMSVSKNMNRIAKATRNWVGLTPIYEATAEEYTELATWVDIDDDYALVMWSTDKRVESPSTFELTIFKDMDVFNCVFPMYGDQQDAAFILAIGASIDWQRINSTVTWFGKSTSGLHARVVDDEVSEFLNKKHINYIGKYAARNSEFRLVNRGILSGGMYGFMDTLYAMIWLRSALQTAIMSGMTSAPRVPYNDRGYAMIGAWMADPINTATRNGVIEAGLMLSEAQKNQVLNEVGEDISDSLFSKGYWYRIDNPSANVRTERDTPVIYFYTCYTGSVQKISFPLTTLV